MEELQKLMHTLFTKYNFRVWYDKGLNKFCVSTNLGFMIVNPDTAEKQYPELNKAVAGKQILDEYKDGDAGIFSHGPEIMNDL